ncbi:bifunctional [glutamine synthetase] adenylyltransferase/[glutamine synthetase]-adenylyl-L-tyrosine phosphorylase [Dermabacter sp. Marseille-Q3180]|uniref:bifunctional [glutamine synthetase] adenylyltransferase/[glutamine synthetase]-adenylyl-L-tyrosine phosphorylase n=1 Tax=Dermabacter sp. Marseille-Q3180 TaxID=2758090 RepID=UPI0020257E9B|nr:bifunctional [glutamine synthetase] adenylyltransferase/[glutamine synthetase]-adenylyl-L-tyrosine phosphorylase [Dermabacter sp. Marseille-Q3180]
MRLETGAIEALQSGEAGGEFTHFDLARLGFVRTDRSAALLASASLSCVPPQLVRAMGEAADPDEALLGLTRLADAAQEAGQTHQFARVVGDERLGRTLVLVLGSSIALGDALARQVNELEEILQCPTLDGPTRESFREVMLAAVGSHPSAAVPVAAPGPEPRRAFRRAYYFVLAQIAARDVEAEAPVDRQAEISRLLSDLADAALEGALALARAATEGHESVQLAIIAMGKSGARELNYVSDVDVMYVAEAAHEGVSEDEVTRVGGALARELARVCEERTADGSLWAIDANLRPEGRDGELVRTIDSYARYYRKWARTWEFQALLKARACAGDRSLGERFEEIATPLVWQASTREGFVDDTRAMRARVLAHADAERDLKLGRGGLRDIEFTIQLLQMVHGRADEDIREAGTLDALDALTRGGYVGREHSAELAGAYRFLRVCEHRLQMWRLRRTHMLPTGERDIRRLARTIGAQPAKLPAEIDTVRRRVRQLHEEIYYRPLLATSAGLSDGQIALSAEAQRDRLEAIGYRDPNRALQHIDALTRGLSRGAAIQKQLLPAFLEWFAGGVDPDLGLLSFRRLSETLRETHWFLGMLRDSGVAAERLTHILSSSRYVGEQLEQHPNTVRWLSNDAQLQPLTRAQITQELDSIAGLATSDEHVIDALRGVRAREIVRICLAHLSGVLDLRELARSLTDLAEAILAFTLTRVSAEADVALCVIAMGSFGAGEMGYSSDADVQFVCEGNLEVATRIAARVQKILNAPASGINMRVNADLRPEGRSGPLVRTRTSFEDYYAHHAERWERQALLRARCVSGPKDICETLTAIMDRERFRPGGMDAHERRDFARMKARIEGERLPRGVRPSHHLKLGRGGTTDVEWCVQRLLLEHAGNDESLRTVGTLDALAALESAGHLTPSDALALRRAWMLAWELRRALFLWRGRESDVLPTDLVDLNAIATLVREPVENARAIEERYLKVTRHSRQVAERLIFDE